MRVIDTDKHKDFPLFTLNDSINPVSMIDFKSR